VSNNEVIGYRALRKLIGLVGFFLPAILVAGKQILAPGPWPGSISDYYYTPMRDELVGALVGIGFFLFTYRGYDRDWIPIRLGGIFSIGVAVCPTIPTNPSHFNNIIGIFHGVFASLFFITLASVAMFLFTKSDKASSQRTRRKRQRNTIYVVCAVIMGVSLVLIPITLHLPVLTRYHPVFWLESSAIMAFGFSWLVKGQAILGDPK
jgi:hypothetical protein